MEWNRVPCETMFNNNKGTGTESTTKSSRVGKVGSTKIHWYQLQHLSCVFARTNRSNLCTNLPGHVSVCTSSLSIAGQDKMGAGGTRGEGRLGGLFGNGGHEGRRGRGYLSLSELAASRAARLDGRSRVDLAVTGSQVRLCGRGSHAVLDLCCHRHERLLNVCGILGTRL